MTYPELKHVFQELKQTSPREDLTDHIVFTEDSFARQYPLISRTYLVSSDNKGFWPHMFSKSIFAYCLDKASDQGVRLDWYMADEGNPGGWHVQDCYILEHMRDAAAVPNAERAVQAGGTVCYFFGDTCICARETRDGEKIRLEPVSGDQAACGEWTDLTIDRVYGYCTLLPSWPWAAPSARARASSSGRSSGPSRRACPARPSRPRLLRLGTGNPRKTDRRQALDSLPPVLFPDTNGQHPLLLRLPRTRP